MDEPAARGRMPWGLLLTIALLSLLLVAAFRLAAGMEQAAPWRVVLSLVLLAAGAFLVLRWLQNYLWGVLAALALALHPLHWQWATPAVEQALRAEALELLVLAAVVAGWRLAACPWFTWRSWLLAAVVLCAGGALAWPVLPQAGLVTALLTALGLPLGALLAVLRHRERPSWLNVTIAVLLGLAAPAAGLWLAPHAVTLLDGTVSGGLTASSEPMDFLSAALDPNATALQLYGCAAEHVQRWSWPAAWVVLPLAVWGLWSALGRGLRQLRSRRPALSWLLPLYAVVDLVGVALQPRGAVEGIVLLLASLVLLLAVFGVAEIVRRLGERLVLLPPAEREW